MNIKEAKDKVTAVLEESERFAEAEEGLLNAKVDVTLKSISILLTELKEGFNTLFQGMAETEHFDKRLGENLTKTISEAISAFTKVNHEIKFAPNISMDFKPLEAELSRSTAQSKSLYGLIEKFSNGTGKQEELFRLIMLLGEKQNNAFEKISNMADIRPQLASINETLNKPKATKWKGKVTKRLENNGVLNGLIDEFEIEVNNK